MAHLFNRIKNDLYLRYQKEMEALVEDVVEANTLSPEEQELQSYVPENLRVSYSRQQLLCLRAMQTRPDPLKCYENKEPPPLPVPRTWNVKEAEQLEWEAELEKDFEEKKEELREHNSELRHMHRLQNEAVRQLRKSILEQEAYKKQKRLRLREQGRKEAEERGEEFIASATDDEMEEDRVEYVDQENLDIVVEGGRYGRPFTSQRLHILDKLEKQLKEEKLVERVTGVM